MTTKIDAGRLSDFAAAKNVKLKVCSAFHYQLDGKYQVNVYPTTGRIYIQGMNYSTKIFDAEEAVQYAAGERFPKGIEGDPRKAMTARKRFLWQSGKKVCGICKLPIATMAEATVDHKIPLARGGSNRMDNLQLAHDACNQEKGSKV